MDENQIPPAQEPTLENLTQQLTTANQLKDEYLAGWQRAKADFSNYQKGEKERLHEVMEFAKSVWLVKLLPVFDNFDRAQQHLPPDLANTEWAKGIAQIHNQFAGYLKEQGIELIEALGKKFNPLEHEALGVQENSGQEPDTIVEVLEKGYRLNGQVLRPAKVKVAK